MGWRVALLLLLLPSAAGCMRPDGVPWGDCQTPEGDFLLVVRSGGGFQVYEAMGSSAVVIRWDGWLVRLAFLTNGSAADRLVVDDAALVGLGAAEATRIARALGYGDDGETRVSGWTADIRDRWARSCELALRVWGLPERDDYEECADGGTTTLEAHTSRGARTFSTYCGGELPATREYFEDWCSHVETAAARVAQRGC